MASVLISFRKSSFLFNKHHFFRKLRPASISHLNAHLSRHPSPPMSLPPPHHNPRIESPPEYTPPNLPGNGPDFPQPPMPSTLEPEIPLPPVLPEIEMPAPHIDLY